MFGAKKKFLRYCRSHEKFARTMEILDQAIRILFFGILGICGVALIYITHMLILIAIGVICGFAFAFSDD